MNPHYMNTTDLQERYRCSSRTIFRKMRRKVNPLPQPAIRQIGAKNLWLTSEILEYEEKAKYLSRRSSSNEDFH